MIGFILLTVISLLLRVLILSLQLSKALIKTSYLVGKGAIKKADDKLMDGSVYDLASKLKLLAGLALGVLIKFLQIVRIVVSVLASFSLISLIILGIILVFIYVVVSGGLINLINGFESRPETVNEITSLITRNFFL